MVKENGPSKAAPIKNQGGGKVIVKNHKNSVRKRHFRLKQELLDLFGKKPEDDYIQAKNRVLSGKPSQLGKKLIVDICPGDVKLQGCHCAKTVWATFRGQLPVVIRNHISEMTFSKDTYKAVFAKADQVWASNQAPEPNPRATVAAVQSNLSDTTTEVAAVGQGRGQPRGRAPSRGAQRTQRGGRGGGRGGSTNQSTPTNPTSSITSKPHKGTKHPTAKGKDDSLCKIHFACGVNAT